MFCGRFNIGSDLFLYWDELFWLSENHKYQLYILWEGCTLTFVAFDKLLNLPGWISVSSCANLSWPTSWGRWLSGESDGVCEDAINTHCTATKYWLNTHCGLAFCCCSKLLTFVQSLFLELSSVEVSPVPRELYGTESCVFKFR